MADQIRLIVSFVKMKSELTNVKTFGLERAGPTFYRLTLDCGHTRDIYMVPAINDMLKKIANQFRKHRCYQCPQV